MKFTKYIPPLFIAIIVASLLISGCNNAPETPTFNQPVVEKTKHDWSRSVTNNFNHLQDLLKDSSDWNLIGQETKLNRECDVYQHIQEPLKIWVEPNLKVVVDCSYELDGKKIFRCRAQSIKKNDETFRVNIVQLSNSLTKEKINIETTSEMIFP